MDEYGIVCSILINVEFSFNFKEELYDGVINDVVNQVRPVFSDDGVDIEILRHLKKVGIFKLFFTFSLTGMGGAAPICTWYLRFCHNIIELYSEWSGCSGSESKVNMRSNKISTSVFFDSFWLGFFRK